MSNNAAVTLSLATLLLLALQIALGLAMIATASLAGNRQIKAPSRTADVLLRVVGRGTFALGIWCLVATTGWYLLQALSGSLNLLTIIVAPLFGLYSLLILSGGWLQSRVASSLLWPPPIEEQRKYEWRSSALRVIGWTLVMMPLGPIAWIALAIGGTGGADLRIQQESLLWILAIAMRTQAPLAEEVDALADSARGRYRKRLRNLAAQLRYGKRLSEALEDQPGLVPAQTVTAIRLGEELGNVAPIIQEEALRLQRREQSRPSGRVSIHGLIFYLFLIFLVVGQVVGFIIIWIIPKFKKIFEDFGVELPRETRLLLRAVDVTQYSPIPVLACLAMLGWATFLLIRRGGWAGLDWSVLSALYPRLETPGILRNLAHAVNVRHPLAKAVGGLELHHRRRHVRGRMRTVRDAILRGQDCFEPLHRSGLINGRETAVLLSAERAGNLAWALDGVADNIERRHQACAQSAIDMVQPAVIILLGFLVLWICVGFFVPLIHLIDSLVMG